MRILVYPHDLNMGGSQMNAIELAAAVTALGHQCIVYGRRGTLCSRIEELGLEFIEAPEPGRRPSLRVARHLRDVSRRRGVDVIHGYEWPPGLEAAGAAEGAQSVAAVCTVMSMAVAPFLPRTMPLIVGTAQISAAEQARGRSRVHLIEPPVDLAHNGPVDAAVVARFRRDHRLSSLPAVAIVSRLVPELKAEGIFTAIRTVEAMDATHPFQLLVVGDGRARGAVQSAADAVNERLGRLAVILTGELADPRPAYAAADVMIGMGGSALRSLAFAKPLVVQGERGYFRTLSADTVQEFRWQGWYGVGADEGLGESALNAALTPLLADVELRVRLGAYGRDLVEDFSLARAAQRQLTIYRDAHAERAAQKRRVGEAARSFAGLGQYYLSDTVGRLRGRRRTDDFNAEPLAGRARAPRTTVSAEREGPILWFPGVGWDTLAGTDRHLAQQVARHRPIIWVDTPHSALRTRGRGAATVSEPDAGIVRLRAAAVGGVQRPLLRALANRRRAQVARRYLATEHMRPSAIVVSTTAPMLDLLRDIPGRRLYYATDDFVEAAGMWGVSRRYLLRARERNLRNADMVLAVTRELGRHLDRDGLVSGWLPNGCDLTRFAGLNDVAPAPMNLPRPVAGVIGQFNSRIDVECLQAVRAQGLGLLLIGPRWFSTPAENDAFDRLIADPGVRWIDELPPEELVPFLRGMDVGLTPYRDSVFNRRSFPLKTVEYLAAGVPVVTTAVASPEGLDARYVHTARTCVEFGALAATVGASGHDADEIRRAAAEHGWATRAEQLLTLLESEGTRWA